jgi:hypothetical protein
MSTFAAVPKSNTILAIGAREATIIVSKLVIIHTNLLIPKIGMFGTILTSDIIDTADNSRDFPRNCFSPRFPRNSSLLFVHFRLLHNHSSKFRLVKFDFQNFMIAGSAAQGGNSSISASYKSIWGKDLENKFDKSNLQCILE